MTENVLVKNLRAYPVLRKRFNKYIKGVNRLPEGFSRGKLFNDYLKVRRNNPEKRVSMSEYMIFGFYGLSLSQQKSFLTDTEATLLMRPYNAQSEPYLKDKVRFLHTFGDFISRDWLYLPDSSPEEFMAFLERHGEAAMKPALSSWGIGFKKLSLAEARETEDFEALFYELANKKYLAEEFLRSGAELARFHPQSLNTIRLISFSSGDRFQVFGAGLRVGNKGRHVDNAHGGGIFCEIDPESGVIITDGLDECGNYYRLHPMTGCPFKGQRIPCWDEVKELCRRAAGTLPFLRVVGWDVAILPEGRLELIEGNHNPGMNIVQAPAKHGVHDKFAAMLLDFYGEPEQYVQALEEERRALRV